MLKYLMNNIKKEKLTDKVVRELRIPEIWGLS
jgi:hypothetical protein